MTNGVYTVGDQSIGGNKIFTLPRHPANLSGNVTGDVTGNFTGTASLARSVVHYTNGTRPTADGSNDGQISFQ